LELAILPKSDFFKNSHNAAGYVNNYGLILMKTNLANERNLQFLLHEICHAIQDYEGRLSIPRNQTKRRYALELEAELFSIIEYRKFYGETKRKWDLANYKTYYLSYLNKEIGSECDSMEEYEIYDFVKNLDGKTKRPIIKVIDKKNKKTLLEYFLSKIYV
jgi:hypothetical protein